MCLSVESLLTWPVGPLGAEGPMCFYHCVEALWIVLVLVPVVQRGPEQTLLLLLLTHRRRRDFMMSVTAVIIITPELNSDSNIYTVYTS